MNLSQKKCLPCQSGEARLTNIEMIDYLKEIMDWKVIAEDEEFRLLKEYHFTDYEETMYFVNKIAALAEHNEHHPVMLVEFRSLKVWWWTHKVGGLHENDFIMAAKTDELLTVFS